MAKIEAEVSTGITESFRTAQVRGMFDLPAGKTSGERFSVEVPGVEEDWQIGLIVGPSGSGKSTVAKKAFGACAWSSFDWPRDVAVVDGFAGGVDMRQITAALAAVGFSSPPAWLRPYHVLSQGEKFRCDMARLLLACGDQVAVMDEFTSVVDRQVAKVGSAAIAKAVRAKGGRKFVAVSCHYDIDEWLTPDWVVDMATCSLARGLLCRPKLEIAIQRCGQGVWWMFKRYHYLSGSVPCGCRFYVGVTGGAPVAFAAIAPQMGFAGYRRFSRVVVLPDYQGIGVGGRFRDAVAQVEAALPGVKRLSLTTSHPAMIRSLAGSPRWRCRGSGYTNRAANGGRGSLGRSRQASASVHAARRVVSFVYRPGHVEVGGGVPGGGRALVGNGHGGNYQA